MPLEVKKLFSEESSNKLKREKLQERGKKDVYCNNKFKFLNKSNKEKKQ
jgi:hypothetical protein